MKSINILVLSSLLIPHIVLSQYPNVRVSSATASAPEEVTIAINPTNPLNLAGGANINYAYRSTDGGLSWIESRLTSTYTVWGDPCVLYDALGNLYYGHLTNPGAPGYFIDRMVVQKSTDGGATYGFTGGSVWNNPPRRGQDKEWLAADMTNSPYRNNIYCAWTEFDSYGSSNSTDSSRIFFSRSTNSGLTWSSTPVRLSDRLGDCIDSDNTVEGAVPAIGPNGEVYVSWSGPLGIVFDKSTDGGMTFGVDKLVTSQPGGWDFDVPGINRCNGLPITACDAGTSPYRGTIYINWSDQRNGTNNTDVFLIKSTDGGTTWGQVKKVNTDSGTSHQFFTWMTIDQTTGFLYFVFYDRRSYTGNITDVYVARSTDGGETFSNFKVSQSSFVAVSGVFFGDYINIAAHNRKIYPIWMRLDGQTLSVWTALVTDTTASTTGIAGKPGAVTGFHLMQNYPNPFNPTTTIGFQIPEVRGRLPAGQAGRSEVNHVTLKVFDVLGREVASIVDESLPQGTHTRMFDASSFPSGVYFYRFTAAGFAATNKMIITK